jgi:hypothetical protein
MNGEVSLSKRFEKLDLAAVVLIERPLFEIRPRTESQKRFAV